MNENLKKAAVLPFQIIESLGVPCGYERSFKLQNNHLLANRYLLGIETAAINQAQWQTIFKQLRMPENFSADFIPGLAKANLALLGFEARHNGQAIIKLYLEYWDQLRIRKQQEPGNHTPHLLHLGFKWQYDAPQRQQITHYHCQPGLSSAGIRNKISHHYSDLPEPACLQTGLSIFDLALTARPQAEFVYIEVSEAGNQRQSFDLNLYPAGLTINDIAQEIELAAINLNIDHHQLEHLMTLTRDKLLGHISAGISRDGQEYFTVYYEN